MRPLATELPLSCLVPVAPRRALGFASVTFVAFAPVTVPPTII
jgi:hypothetical protein